MCIDYNVVVIEDCCSSQTEEIQKANIVDMKNIGAFIMTSKELLAMEKPVFKDSVNRCREFVRR
jgi:isochorismatase hydrolase